MAMSFSSVDRGAARLSNLTGQILAMPVAGFGGASRFNDRVCLVTGGASGIGRTISERLASEGARAIVIFDIADAAPATVDLKKINPSVEVHAAKVDLTKEAEVAKGVGEVLAAFGQIDVLVQAAGITGKTNIKSHEVDPADFQKVFDINLKAIFLMSRAILPSMMKHGYGRIVNIASISGKDGNAGMLAYSSSKAAVIALTKVMGKEYANLGHDITINCIAPATVMTDMVLALPKETVKYMTDKIPMGRMCTKEEVAATVCFAASPECSFTTGFCFDATGGRTVY